MRAVVGRLAGAELLNSGTLPNFETDPIPTFQLSPNDSISALSDPVKEILGLLPDIGESSTVPRRKAIVRRLFSPVKSTESHFLTSKIGSIVLPDVLLHVACSGLT